MSQRGACRVIGLARSACTYRPVGRDDDAVIAVLQELSERFPERGFSKYFKILRRRGHVSFPVKRASRDALKKLSKEYASLIS